MGSEMCIRDRSMVGSAGGDGARFGRGGWLHRIGAAALATDPRHDDIDLIAGGDCGFQPTAFFFHGLGSCVSCCVGITITRICGAVLAGLQKVVAMERARLVGMWQVGHNFQDIDFNIFYLALETMCRAGPGLSGKLRRVMGAGCRRSAAIKG